MIEYELTYLAKFLPQEIGGLKPEAMIDIYLPQNPEVHHPNLRIRQRGDKLEITKKKPVNKDDSSAQLEQTIPLTAGEFSDLKKASKRLVVKDRYSTDIAGHRAEIDVFQGDLKGLVLIDFEFKDETGKSAFKPPACCLADVTQEHFIAGGLLAGKNYSDIRSDLERYGYQPIF